MVTVTQFVLSSDSCKQFAQDHPRNQVSEEWLRLSDLDAPVSEYLAAIDDLPEELSMADALEIIRAFGPII